MNPLSDKHLPMQPQGLIDSDYTGIALLLTDLQVAVAFLDRKEQQRHAASFPTVQRHARRTYDEVMGLMPHLTISDDNRRHLELQLAVMKVRLMQLGEEFSEPTTGPQ